MKKTKMLLPIGTKVFDIRYGWGIVNSHRDSEYHILVKFYNDIISYTNDGKHYTTENASLLSLTEYSLENGGFTPITAWNKPKVGDIGYFWNSEKQLTISYSKIIEISNGYFYTNPNFTQWENFSKEVPQWFIEKMS